MYTDIQKTINYRLGVINKEVGVEKMGALRYVGNCSIVRSSVRNWW
jgi:hypothetical protein